MTLFHQGALLQQHACALAYETKLRTEHQQCGESKKGHCLMKRRILGMLTVKIPPHIKVGIRELGLRTQDETVQVLVSDNLELASKHAAETAAYHGNRGQWWRLWLDIQDALGTPMVKGISSIDARSLRRLGEWAAAEQRRDLAIMALTRYHQQADTDDPQASDVSTLAGLLVQGGDFEQLLTLCDCIRCERESSQVTESYRVVAILHTEGEGAARAVLDLGFNRYPHSSALWLLGAILEKEDPIACGKCLEICAKSGSFLSESLLKYAQERIPDLEPQLEAWKKEFCYQFEFDDDERLREAWCASRGARPYAVKNESPHWFGGDYLAMPDCVGCDSKLTQYFLIDPVTEPLLAGDLEMWPKLPFFACTECCVHLGRNDFLVRWPERRVEWIAHELSPKTFGRKSAAAPTLPKTNIGLRWLPSVSCVEEIPFEEMRGDPPQIGGDPDWAQYLERLYCPRCHEEMLFYGSLGSTDDFKPFSIMVNNGCGYLYHFACNRCHVISVISQCT